MKLFMLVCLCLAAVGVNAKYYCNETLCRTGTHVGCNNPVKFHERCRKPGMFQITPQLRELILESHNKKRDFVASGGDGKLMPACRMPVIQWDTELAILAALNTLQCQLKHDECFNTFKYRYAGQNIATTLYTGKLNRTNLLLDSIESWYSEIKNTHQEDIDAFPRTYSSIGHFTQIVKEDSTHVGCAASTFKTLVDGEMYEQFLFTCNYAFTNILDWPIYKSCAQSASECTIGSDDVYPHLCAVAVAYDEELEELEEF